MTKAKWTPADPIGRSGFELVRHEHGGIDFYIHDAETLGEFKQKAAEREMTLDDYVQTIMGYFAYPLLY